MTGGRRWLKNLQPGDVGMYRGQGMLNRSPRASARDLDRYIGVNLAFSFNSFLFFPFSPIFQPFRTSIRARFIRDPFDLHLLPNLYCPDSFTKWCRKKKRERKKEKSDFDRIKFPFVRSSRNLIVSRTRVLIRSIDKKSTRLHRIGVQAIKASY